MHTIPLVVPVLRRGQKNDGAHSRQDEDQEEDPGAPPTVEFDYGFPSVRAKADDDDVALTTLVGFDKKSLAL